MRRQRIKHTASFEERLAAEAKRLKEQAKAMPIGQKRDHCLRRARQMDTAAHIDKWINSPGLAPPE